MSARKFSIMVIIIVLFLSIVPSLIVFIVDPIQLYHNQIALKNTKYFTEQRHQNMGLINKFLVRGEGKYTIIMGTSMSDNFIASKVEKMLKDNTKVIKITMDGGRPLEQFIVLKKALKTGKVKRVIWDIHWYFFLQKISQKDKNHEFPSQLYSDNIFTQGFYYLFNDDYVINAIKLFFGKENHKKWTENLDKLYCWMDSSLRANKFKKNSSTANILKMNRDIKKNSHTIPTLDMIQKQYVHKLKYDSIDEYVLPLLKKYPTIEFDLFFPPYSTYFYAKSKNDKSIRYIYAKKYLVEKTKNLPNVTIFGFDNNYEIVNNIYNYKDYGHYRDDINDYIAQSIAQKKHIINDKNINNYINNMISNINHYDKVYFEDNTLKNLQLLAKLNFKTLKWKTNGKITQIKTNQIAFSAKNIKKFVYLDTKIKPIHNVKLVKLKVDHNTHDVNMYSITLRDKKEYAHYFIKAYGNKNIVLTQNNISKNSKNFILDTITQITIRAYPKKGNSIKTSTIRDIEFYGKGEFQ